MAGARVASIRVSQVNTAPVRPDGDHVVYWMTAARRAHHNFALDRALEHARELQKPLVVLEALRCGYPWASDRTHAFVLAGMAANRRAFADSGVAHHAWVEREPGDGNGLLEALAARACVVVTDDWPCFFLPRMVAAAGRRLPVSLEQVDGNGLLPMRAADRVFRRAFDFRRYLQRRLPDHLDDTPVARPLRRLRDLPRARVPADVRKRWPAATDAMLRGGSAALGKLPIDHDVAPSTVVEGGAEAGAAALADFVKTRLARYGEDRNHPDDDASSGLSPYLHFGHVGAHQILRAVGDAEDWSPERIDGAVTGKADGDFWGTSHAAASFLDELVTWRELGFNMCSRSPDDYDRYESLPDWAQQTLAEHESDPRPHLYSLDEFAEARTHDEIWNAAQLQLRHEGRIHNYLRMLWGKKILEWTPSARDALAVMIELNNRYALDGRDPNSYSGIFWVLGRYDRAWGPERPVYGKVRYMTSGSTRRKLRLGDYLARMSALGAANAGGSGRR